MVLFTGTIYNTVPTSITFTTAPTVTESSEGLSVNFNDGITDATAKVCK